MPGPIMNLLRSNFGHVLFIFALALSFGWLLEEVDFLQSNVALPASSFVKNAWTWIYEYALNLADGDKDKASFYINVYGSQVFHITTFWIHCGLLSIFDLFPRTFSWAHKWKIQEPGVEIDRKKLLGAMRTCIFNQIFVNLPLAYIAYPLITMRGAMETDPSSLPSYMTLIKHMMAFSIVEEFGFYYFHRLAHVPKLYQHSHKQHHEWTAPCGFIAIYADPIEHVMSNLLPVMAGPYLMKSHCIVYWFWLFVAVHVTIQVHSGYHFPLTPSPEFHDFHHLKFNVNYGVLGLLDWFHGTDEMFYRPEWKHLSDRDRTFVSVNGPIKEMEQRTCKKELRGSKKKRV